MPHPALPRSSLPAALRVAVIADIANFDPHQFSSVNAPLIKNLYDTLIEYTPEGKAIPSLATAWTIAPDNKSVTLSLRKDVKFHSGGPFNAEAVAATLKKATDPSSARTSTPPCARRRWTVVDPATIRLDFKAPAPERQITDLLQFISIIDPAGIDTVERSPRHRRLHARRARRRPAHRLTANPNYWRESSRSRRTS